MERIPFSQWWAEFAREHRGDRDGGNRAVQDLVDSVRKLEATGRHDFLDELVRIALAGHSVAAAALEECAQAPQVETLCTHLSPLPTPASSGDEWRLASLLRILAADRQQACSLPVEEFLLRRHITACWPSVPWALWPHNTELFVAAWTRYFSNQPPARWFDTAIVQAFLEHPDALAELRKGLATTGSEGWKALSSSLHHQLENAQWLHENTRVQLNLILAAPSV